MVEDVTKRAERTCIACRRTGAKDDLLRFVLSPDRCIVPDLLSRLPGRGAYTCLDPVCVDLAMQRRQFSRAFKAEILVAGHQLAAEISTLIHGRMLHLLAMANKAGVVVSGGDSVERAIASSLPNSVIWIAADASADRREKYTFSGRRAGCIVHVGNTSAELGGVLGKEQRTFLLLKPSGITAKLKNELERFRKFIDGGTQEP